MAKLRRIVYAAAVYHVTPRDNKRQAIFQDDADREWLVHVLGESVGHK